MEENTVHILKCSQPYFDHICNGSKTFEIRLNERNYKVGDRLDIFEGTQDIDVMDINRKHVHVYITYVLEGGKFGIENGYCIMGISY